MNPPRAMHLGHALSPAGCCVAAWLGQHGVETRAFTDALAACVHLLRSPVPPPDFVFVDGDWLAEDEAAILAYVLSTWPNVALLVYGRSPTVALTREQLCRVHLCGDPRAMQALLADVTPQQLAARLRSDQAARDAQTSGVNGATQAAAPHSRGPAEQVELTRAELIALGVIRPDA